MEFAMKENVLTAKDYQRLRSSVGWSVLPEQQIDTALRNFEQGIPDTNITLGLFAALGKEGFYQKHGFHIRPSDSRGAGMEIILPIHQDTGA